MRLEAFLNQPYFYLDSLKNKWIYVLNSSLFVLFFLILFQPYGISEEISSPVNSNENIALFFLSISFSTFIGLSLSQFVLRPIINFNKVSIGKYVLWLLFEALIITSINFAFSFLIPDLGNDFENELNIFFQLKNYFRAIIILLFPFLGTTIYIMVKELNIEIQKLENQIHRFQSTYKVSQLPNEELHLIYDENDNLELELNLKNFLLAESNNQYVLIYYWDAGILKKHLVRMRLKTILETFKQFPIEQCHRSYAINLLHVKTLIKKEGKTFLIMNNLKEIDIPVSKSYLNSIRSRVLNT
ncbi:LytTR family DNA-binding domain-containing protein [Mariniflexile litorale]|uniref:LytTR family DNA-binding domain-containing protein n=1 Tax=Mariniflexile litorale TaxID=3045158 RepID=A0AAU7EJC2_9FLAO|nr:LytTR family DNA-binding domain-containing protein [Mariniflexile sp. KMM 9835]MDQ8211312.1 LytTR family DNA-binding domain-containing protein [Mariniflexile sp. KMM 9835]